MTFTGFFMSDCQWTLRIILKILLQSTHKYFSTLSISWGLSSACTWPVKILCIPRTDHVSRLWAGGLGREWVELMREGFRCSKRWPWLGLSRSHAVWRSLAPAWPVPVTHTPQGWLLVTQDLGSLKSPGPKAYILVLGHQYNPPGLTITNPSNLFWLTTTSSFRAILSSCP